MPSGRRRPSGLGMYTRMTRRGRYLFAFKSSASSSRKRSMPWRSTSSMLWPSTPATPRFAGLLSKPATECRARPDGHTKRKTDGFDSSWPQDTVCAGAVVISRRAVIGSLEHAPSLTSSMDTVEAGALPSGEVLLSPPSAVVWSPPTSRSASPRTSYATGLYFGLGRPWSLRSSEIFLVSLTAFSACQSPYAGKFFAATVQSLRLFRDLHDV